MSKSNFLSVHAECLSPQRNCSSDTLETGNAPISNENTHDCSKSNDSKQDADMQHIVKAILKRSISDDVTDDVCEFLADHCKNKLKKIVETSADYMKCCGRQKFTVEDFNKGLVFCGETPIVPHQLLYSSGRRKNKRNKKTRVKTDPEKQHQKVTEHANADELCNSICPELSTDLLRSVTRNEKWLNHETPLSQDLCDLPNELQVYFSEITKTLIDETEDVCSIIFNDFKTNKNIYNLVPHFVSFFCDAVNNYNSDFLRISVLLKSIQSLLLNPNLYFGEDVFLNMLAHALLKFLLSHLPIINKGIDNWLLKDTAASILALILKRSNSKELFFHVLSEINSVLSDFMKGLYTHYGGLVALNSIGVPALVLLIPSYLDRYIEHMNSIFVLNYENRQHACMIEDQIMQSYYLLVNHCFKYEFSGPISYSKYKGHSKFYLPGFLNENSVFPILLQLKFNDYFGDSLVHRYPLLDSSSHIMQEIKEKKMDEKTETFSFGKKLHPKKFKSTTKSKHVYLLYSALLL